MPLSGSTAIVTGASRGLGAALAMTLAGAGADVALCARRDTELAGVAKRIRDRGRRVYHGTVDVTDRQAVLAFLSGAREALGPADILVNNAGVGWYKPFLDHSFEELERVVDVNLKATLVFCRAVLPDMVGRGRGKILNIASDLGRRPIANMAPYVAAKHGVVGFSGSLVREVKQRGIRVMSLMPGIMDTHFSGPPGEREESWAMNPDHVAALALQMLTQPACLMTDEVTVHPLYQDF